MVTTVATVTNAANQLPTGDCANECTLSTTPLLVRNVPRIERRNVTTTSTTFHFRSIPRFSWIMIECRNAVPVSHGRNDAFSTGSHAQYPLHPSSMYAQFPPRMIPQVRKPQAISVQRRV